MLELKNISFHVTEGDSQVDIIQDLSLTVDNRKFVVITGPNGSGKSTLAKIIAGIEQPTSGQILLDGQDITHKSITERAQMGISFAFQQPVRFRGLQVIDLLRLAAGKKISHIKACDYLAEVGLCANDYVNREVNSSLSGGELKRIEIATILARKTNLSIFDEPEAGIDLWSFQNLIRIFEKMRSEIADSSIIIISHQERILQIADEIIVLADGRVQEQGAGQDILPKIMDTEVSMPMCRKFQ
ncbi:MAG: ATP-binding cassette domain-containing protein [Selenomonas sp.]|uniref:ABC transporter ATP-binding protein n=1 Tax=Selenomonas sp. TaxID=2053611 RepID=UPI0025CCA7ED|nr:ATP-binding cassette domain-containing protein [Selenomonas sp.]MCR5756523.1 ATP-binding cassette domain-containing protein [Selenomonas sp.]